MGGGNLGSEASPLELSIKGHGNATWRAYDKKPYRIKLSQKQPLLGMKKNKHFVLLALMDDNGRAFLKYPVAFELSKRIGLGWTPDYRFVELVLNGDYRGLYLLVEKIRIDKDRINVTEQKNGEEDEENVTGGWLLEFDNYEENQQIRLTEGVGKPLWVTYHSPDSLSEKQERYLTDLIERCDACIYRVDKSNREWEDYIDVESLAKFYMVQEIMGHREAFMGSTYLYKDRGQNEKLKFGPLWDMGAWIYNGGINSFIYENPPYDEQHWIAEVAKFPHFQEVVRDIWNSFRNNLDLHELESNVVTHIQTAAENNYKRWQFPQLAISLEEGWDNFARDRAKKIAFLDGKWGVPLSISNPYMRLKDTISAVYTIDGRRAYSTEKQSLLIKNGKKYMNVTPKLK